MKQQILNLFALRSVKDKQEKMERVGKRWKGQDRTGRAGQGRGRKKDGKGIKGN